MSTRHRIYLAVEQSNDDLDDLVQLTAESVFSSHFERSSRIE